MAKARHSLPLAVGLLLMVFAQGAGAATLAGDYRLQGTYSSSVAGAPPLTDLGTGNSFQTAVVRGFRRKGLVFPQHNGLRVATTNSLIDNNAHSVVMLFRLTDVSGYRRLIEAKNGGTDSGLYIKGGKLDFYGRTGPTTHTDFIGADTVLTPNTWAEVAYAVSYDSGIGGNLVAGYVNGVLQFSDAPDPFNDVFLPGGGGGGLNFFKDNTSDGGLGEDSAGEVTCIRLYNGTLTQAEVTQIYNDRACPTRPPQARASVTGKAKAQAKGKSIMVRTGITAACPAGAAAPCSGTGSLDRAGGSKRAHFASASKRLGRTSFSVPAGRTRKVKVKLRRKAAKALRRVGALRINISVTAMASGGNPATATRTVRIRAPNGK
jgi:hypothetical protein